MAKKYDIIFYKSYSVTDIEADNEDDALEYAESVIPKEFKYYDDFDVNNLDIELLKQQNKYLQRRILK